jgi:hypothetical protein
MTLISHYKCSEQLLSVVITPTIIQHDIKDSFHYRASQSDRNYLLDNSKSDILSLTSLSDRGGKT